MEKAVVEASLRTETVSISDELKASTSYSEELIPSITTNGSGALSFADAGISTGKAIAMAIVFG